MSRSNTEEIISALWAICSILCFASGFNTWALLFALKAVRDMACSIILAWHSHKGGKPGLDDLPKSKY